MDTTPNPAWLHGLWAAVVALFWKLMAARHDEVKEVKKDVANLAKAVAAHNVTLATHKTLHEQIGLAIIDLKTTLKETGERTRQMTEAVVRIETILENASGKFTSKTHKTD